LTAPALFLRWLFLDHPALVAEHEKVAELSRAIAASAR
jgi:hypothetical protein